MTISQKRKILVRISELESDIEQLKRARLNIGTSEYASATLASSGGSKSFTRMDLDKITNLISELTAELKQYRKLLAGQSGIQPTSQTVIWS